LRTPRRILATVALAAILSARADVVVVVSVRSPVQSLNAQQVEDIFLGRTRAPSADGPLEPVDLAEGSADRDDFYRRTAGMSATQITSYWAHMIFTGRGTPPLEIGSESAVRQLMSRNPRVLAYLPRKDVDDTMRIVFVPR